MTISYVGRPAVPAPPWIDDTAVLLWNYYCGCSDHPLCLQRARLQSVAIGYSLSGDSEITLHFLVCRLILVPSALRSFATEARGCAPSAQLNTDVRPQLWSNLLPTLRSPRAPQLMQLTRQVRSVPAAKQQSLHAGMPNRPPAAQELRPRNRSVKAVPEEQEERQALEVEYKSTKKLQKQTEEDAESDHAAQTTGMAKQRTAKPGIPLTPENVAIGIVYFTQGADA